MNSLIQHTTDLATDFNKISNHNNNNNYPTMPADDIVMNNSSDLLAPISLRKLRHHDFSYFVPGGGKNDNGGPLAIGGHLLDSELMMLSQLSINENSEADEEVEAEVDDCQLLDTASDEFPVSCLSDYHHLTSTDSSMRDESDNDVLGSRVDVKLGTQEDDLDGAALPGGDRNGRCIEKILIGRHGKAKNEQMHLNEPANGGTLSPVYLNENSHLSSSSSSSSSSSQYDNSSQSYLCKAVHESVLEKLSFGDDVAFVFRPTNEAVASDEANNKRWYFGLADGVSANRLRGYDAKQFPNALIKACSNFLLMDSLASACRRSTSPAQKSTSNATCAMNVKSESKSRIEDLVTTCEDAGASHLASNTNSVPLTLSNRSFSSFLRQDSGGGGGGRRSPPSASSSQEEKHDQNKEVLEFFERFKESINLEHVISDNDLGVYEQINECKKLFNVLLDAHKFVLDKNVFGSSTICLLSLTLINNNNNLSLNDNDHNSNSARPSAAASGSHCALLTTCNLGDSGYIIIRDRKVKYKSASQSHRYNAPYQLGCTPPELLDHDLYRDKPEDALFTTHILFPDDFLIISSDGLFDNLYEDEIAELVYEHTSSFAAIDEEVLHSTSRLLVQKACKAEIKRDDILVIIIHIK